MTGSSISGSWYFGTDFTDNYFDPVGTAVGIYGVTALSTVVDLGEEFRFFHIAGLIGSADFTDTGLTTTYVPRGYGFQVTEIFVSTAFEGMNVTKISDDFANGGVSANLVGSTLTIVWPSGAVVDNGQTFTASFALQSDAPEPGTMLLLSSALAGLALLSRRRE